MHCRGVTPELLLTFSAKTGLPESSLRCMNSKCSVPYSARILLPPEAHGQFLPIPLHGEEERRERLSLLVLRVYILCCSENRQNWSFWPRISCNLTYFSKKLNILRDVRQDLSLTIRRDWIQGFVITGENFSWFIDKNRHLYEYTLLLKGLGNYLF